MKNRIKFYTSLIITIFNSIMLGVRVVSESTLSDWAISITCFVFFLLYLVLRYELKGVE